MNKETVNNFMKEVKELADKYNLVLNSDLYGLISYKSNNSENPDSKEETATGLSVLIDNANLGTKRKLISNGLGLDILINDKDPYVRAMVAKQGYGLDKLINDPDPYVKKAIIELGYGLDQLINDPDPEIVSAVLDFDIHYVEKISADKMQQVINCRKKKK